ncbi:hypothetical protein [Halapricum desulfuricans]|uniref:hypothetical protein n=1 Tax=Halapricum desulfuricans TaxID=2841257 RepID=UPI001E40D98B|nr:hypothetical protein [Halapricum desulfuricans]
MALEALVEQYRSLLVSVGLFVVAYLAVYAAGRVLFMPPVVRIVHRRNENNPTLENAVDLYTRVFFVVLAFPVAVTAAGLGRYLSGSAIVVAVPWRSVSPARTSSATSSAACSSSLIAISTSGTSCAGTTGAGP